MQAPVPSADNGCRQGILTLDVFSGPQPGEKTQDREWSPGLGILQPCLGVAWRVNPSAPADTQGPRHGLCGSEAAKAAGALGRVEHGQGKPAGT